jgi:signal transduction histidine kinase
MSTPSFIPAKVLIVDDEPSNVRLLERMLDLFGGLEYRCTIDPREVVPLFAEFQPDLVLTDLHMPHMDGYQLMEQLRQIIPEDSFLPIVVLTADITAETRRKALASGASDFITKPLDTTEVQLRIRNLLENRFLHLRLEDQVRQRTNELETALDQLRNAQEQVVKQERLRALGMMAGGIAHDFNNTLTMTLGYGELLLPWFAKTAPDSKEHGYMQHIVQAAQDATHVVRGLREFYRPPDKNEMRSPVCLSMLCEQVVAFTAPKWRAKRRDHAGRIDVQTAVVPVPKVLGCAPELREVVINLIFNAVDAMPAGGLLTVGTQAEGDMVRLTVSDTGIGMTEEERDRCLEPFYTTKGEGGSGLGLAVAYGIIDRHGGRIEIESTKGKGTTFSLLLPVTSQETSEVAPAEEPAVAAPLRVLVVDDQEIICELLAEHLRADGHEVAYALDGAQALESFQATPFDLVITDQSMPGLNGEELGREVRRTHPHTPVILLTGFGDEMKASGILPEGITMVLSKPVAASDLRRAVFEAVQGV